MLTLNLLSQEKKEEQKFRKIYLMGKDFTFIIIIFTILTAIILSVANMILVNNFNDIISNSYVFGENNKLFEKDLDTINTTLQNIKKIQSDFIEYDELLIKITNYIPKDIILTHLSVNTKINKMALKGTAPKRDDFLKLTTNLKDSNIFKNIESPIGNLLEKNNINFNITADLNLNN